MLIKNAQVFCEGATFRPGDIAIEGERFAEAASGGESIDAAGCYAIPGLIDIHSHGCVHNDYSSADLQGIIKMARYQAQNGITSICPATMTLPEETLRLACERLAGYAATGDETGAKLVGINLEGPFVSAKKAGAQNPAHIIAPDIGVTRRLVEAAHGLVKLLAVAPEAEGAMELIREFKDELGCSVAHTTADYDTALQAFSNGARHVTHLFNAMPPFTHRAPGVVGAALDSPHCRVELICDGIHIHPSMVRAVWKMFGDDRIILISDSMMAAGMEDGLYELGGLPVNVKGNTATLNDGTIAGSVTNLMRCVRVAAGQMGIPLASAVKCASINPAKAIGVFADRGSITPGKSADLVLLDKDLHVKSVILRGRKL